MDNYSLRINKYINWLLIIGLVLSLGSVGFYTVAIRGVHKAAVSEPFTRNMLFPNTVNDREIRYYNGTTFLALDTQTYKTRTLSSHFLIPDVTQVFWLKNGVVFASAEAGSFGDLSDSVKQLGVIQPGEDEGNPIRAVPTYWYLSFTTNQFKPISTNIMSPTDFGVAAEDGTFVFKERGDTYAVLRPDGTISHEVITPNKGTRPVYATSDNLTYLEQDGDKVNMTRVGLTSKSKSNIIFKNVFGTGDSTIHSQIMATDATHYLYKESVADDTVGGDVSLLSITDNKRTKLLSSFDGLFEPYTGGVVAANKGREYITLYAITNQGVTNKQSIKIPGSNPSDALLINHRFVYITKNGEARMVGQDGQTPAAVKEAYKGNLEQEIPTISNGFLTRNIESDSDVSYSITFNGKWSDAIQAFRSAVAAKGYDPNQFTITLAPGRGAEF